MDERTPPSPQILILWNYWFSWGKHFSSFSSPKNFERARPAPPGSGTLFPYSVVPAWFRCTLRFSILYFAFNGRLSAKPVAREVLPTWVWCTLCATSSAESHPLKTLWKTRVRKVHQNQAGMSDASLLCFIVFAGFGHQDQPGAARSSQEQPEATRDSQ